MDFYLSAGDAFKQVDNGNGRLLSIVPFVSTVWLKGELPRLMLQRDPLCLGDLL